MESLDEIRIDKYKVAGLDLDDRINNGYNINTSINRIIRSTEAEMHYLDHIKRKTALGLVVVCSSLLIAMGSYLVYDYYKCKSNFNRESNKVIYHVGGK